MSVLRTPDSSRPRSLALRLSLAAPEALRALSGGEVRSPAGFDERGRPAPGGLFCPGIFGAGGETCGCGRAGAAPGEGCAWCGRPGARFAHVELACPVAHPWFLRLPPSPIACLLGLAPRDLRRLLYGDGDVAAGEGERGLPPPGPVPAGEALAERLRRVDLDVRIGALREAHAAAGEGAPRARARRRLRALEALRQGGTAPERMLLRVVPVLPPGLRPLGAGPYDLGRLYASVVEANLRVADELGRGAGPSLGAARRALQRAVDRLFLHGAEAPRLAGAGSLGARALGRRGALRAHFAPKRVAFSAAIDTAPDAALAPGECALPAALARELYRPFVLARLAGRGFAASAASAAAFDEALAAVSAERPLLVARARVRGRSAMRAFWPRLVEGKALGLAPLACAALGLAGRGERVRLHVPLSGEACDDLAERMAWPAAASRAGGGQLPLPTPQARLGLAYATSAPRPAEGGVRLPAEFAVGEPTGELTPARRGALVALALEGGGLRGFFASPGDVRRAYDAGEVDLHAALVLREGGVSFLTSAGRALVGEALAGLVGFAAIDRELDRRALEALLHECRRRGGDHEAALVVERLERLGLDLATGAGLSLSADDLRPPAAKPDAIARARAEIEKVQRLYDDGLITDGERYNKTVDAWAGADDRVGDALRREHEAAGGPPPPLALLVRAGLVSKSAARRLAGMRGLTAKRSGEIHELAVAASLHEGQSPHEYFLEACHGRAGALGRLERARGADALLARLAACCADVVIAPGDCGSEGVELRTPEAEHEPLRWLRGRAAWGRLLAADVPAAAEAPGGAACRAGEPFDEAACRAIAAAGQTTVRVRSPLACRAARGVCAACYGRPTGRRGLASPGEAVGVLAALAIGEAARRLTQRTYHICCGSWDWRRRTGAELSAAETGWVRLHGAFARPRGDGKLVVTGRAASLTIVDAAGRELAYEPLAAGTVLRAADGQKVEPRETLAELDPFFDLIVAEAEGVARYDDLVEGATVAERFDAVTGLRLRYVREAGGGSLSPRVRVVDAASGATAPAAGGAFEAQRALPPGAELVAREGQRVHVGDVLAKVLKPTTAAEFETGGLPRLLETLEARAPQGAALLADVDGIVSIEKPPSGGRRLIVTPVGREGAPGGGARTYPLAPGRLLRVGPGDGVRRGEVLVDGPHDPHDLLRIHGLAWFTPYLVEAIGTLFAISELPLDPRHVELVVRQMLRFVRIDDGGDTSHVPGDLVDGAELERESAALARRGARPARARPALVGIDQSARLRESWLGRAGASPAPLARAALAGECAPLDRVREAVAAGGLAPLGAAYPEPGRRSPASTT